MDDKDKTKEQIIQELQKRNEELKKAKNKYKHISNELEAILDYFPGLIFYKDTKNNFIRVNKYVADAHGMTKQELERKNLFDIYSNEQAQAYWDDDLKVINSSKPKLNIVETWETEEGTKWVETSKIPFINEDGDIVGIIGISIDITDLKQAEETLKAKNQQLDASNQQLKANEQQLKAINQQLTASEQQLKASNQQLTGNERHLLKLNHDLTERAKELNCFYKISEIVEIPDITLDGIIQKTVEIIPHSWQFPEITCARIIIDGREFITDNFKITEWKLDAVIKIRGKKRGMIEVYYLEPIENHTDSPFFEEERLLIKAVAERLGKIIRRFQVGQELNASNQQLDTSNLQLDAANQQLKATNQQLDASNQQLKSTNQQLNAANQQLKDNVQQLWMSGERFRKFFEYGPEYCYIISPEGLILNVNRTALKTLGYKKEELVGNPLKTIYAPESLDRMKLLFVKWEETGELRNEEIGIITKTGDKRTVLLSVTAVKNENGEIQHSISIQRDITEQQKLQKQLIQSEKLSAIGHLASGIAHEFNNILAIISINLQMLQLNYNKGEITLNSKSNETLKVIGRNVERGADIVNNMTSFAKPKEPKKELCDVSEIIDDVLKIEKEFFRLENIETHRNYSNIRKSKVDKGQMYQVFINLINNARHAILPSGKGEIIISVADAVQGIEIKVSDTGVGINKEHIKNLFNPFYTTKGARADNNLGIQGTGLGLSVSHAIIQNHNGTISIKSELGKGTTFIINIPEWEAEKEYHKKEKDRLSSKEIGKSRELNILIVDDEMDFVRILNYAFEEMGYKNATVVNSGKDALKIFEEKLFDIVFLDMLLPDMRGEDIFKTIKLKSPEIPVVFISGQVGLDESDILDKGAYAFLQKPFDINDMFEILNKIVKEKST